MQGTLGFIVATKISDVLLLAVDPHSDIHLPALRTQLVPETLETGRSGGNADPGAKPGGGGGSGTSVAVPWLAPT